MRTLSRILKLFLNINVDRHRYDFEQNKKNNLIFHGIIADHPETPEGWVLTAEMEISYQNLLNPTLMIS